MRVHRIGWKTFWAASTVLLIMSHGLVAGGATVVSPSSAEDVDGDFLFSDTGGPGRLQYLFPASDFASLPESHRLIVGWNLRSDKTQTEPVDWTFNNFKIWMSTTDKDSLTSIFDDNSGSDKTLVHDGTITKTFVVTGPPEGPKDFGGGTPLHTPFDYDPSQGNLLMESEVFENSVPFPGPTIDAQSTAEATLLAGPPGSTSGSLYNSNGVFQFVFVPEPLLGDLNVDGEVNGLDVDPFVDVLLNGPYQPEADMNEDQVVNGLDVDPFVAAVVGGGAQAVPEPSTLLLCLVALGVVGGWRKWSG
jgi:hypothetical protein